MSSIDYRMARRATLHALELGMVSQPDVCDAHPELVRAASHVGEEIAEPCPVCDEKTLRLVVYTFGKGLRRGNGYPRRSSELPELRAKIDELQCYAVEVCTDCSWNHLVRSWVTGRRHAV